MEELRGILRHHWGELILTLILFCIIAVNVRPGYVLLGNDNFSPELNPGLTFSRALYSPGWRSYRAQGIPSDSEQSDIVRAGVFTLLAPVLPPWVLSQGYMFLAFFIGSFAMAHFAKTILRARHQQHLQAAFLLAGLSYLCSMLTIWIFFFPVHLFVAAYAFFPLVLWRLAEFIYHPRPRHAVWLVLGSLMMAPAALTATMFLVGALVIMLASVWLLLTVQRRLTARVSLLAAAWVLVFGVHLFWLLPFTTYVRTQVVPLRESQINRDITTTTIENERKHNTAVNSIRFYAAWMDTKEEGNRYTFPQRDWYKTSSLGLLLSFIPLALMILGVLVAGKKHWVDMLIPAGMIVGGWFFIKGANPPLGSVFESFQQQFPVIAQVFRWQSSKLWPFIGFVQPVFVALAVVGFARLFRGILRPLGLVIFVGLAGGLLIFIYPLFRGQLIRDGMYQRVPAEYEQLAAYLEKHDPTGRIYPAPEANTLYFRNYEWGFWGSVLLHYLLPNPLIEKALIIGSAENQQAFTVIMNAYYTRDPAVFTRALRRYDVDWVLSDKNVGSQQRGYVYDWDVHTKVVEQNPDLEIAWKEGNLALYRLKAVAAASPEAVYDRHDWTKLAVTQVVAPQAGDVATAPLGTIYPLALSGVEWESHAHAVQGNTVYRGAPGTFRLEYDRALTSSIPTQIALRGEQVVFTPALPLIRVNDTPYGEARGRFSGIVPSGTAFLTLDRTVTSIAGLTVSPVAVSVPVGLILGADTVRSWADTPELLNLRDGDARVHCPADASVATIPLATGKPVTCATGLRPVMEDSIIELRGTIQLPEGVKATLCVFSELERRCLNTNVTAFGTGLASRFTMLIPTVVNLGDSLQVFLTAETTGNEARTVDVPALEMRLYRQSLPLPLVQEELVDLPQATVPLQSGDSLSVSVPLLTGERAWRYHADDLFIPETAITLFEAAAGQGEVKQISENALQARIREGTLSTFPKWERVNSEGLAMMSYDVLNSSGIPLELSLRELKAGNKLYQVRINGKTSSRDTAFVLLPTDLRSYQLEALHTGIGPQTSVNTLRSWQVQMVPQVWTRLRLLPEAPAPLVRETELRQVSPAQSSTYSGDISEAGGTVVTIPTSVSPYWRITPAAVRTVLLNGWKQGWEVSQAGSYTVAYSGNTLSWAGAAVGIMGVLSALFWVWKWGTRWTSRAKSPHEPASRTGTIHTDGP